MRYSDIAGHIKTVINNEEHTFLENFNKTPVLEHDKLSERDQELARLLTSRGVIHRFSENKKVKYRKLSKARRL